MTAERRPNFDFIEMGIPFGSELVAVSDPNVKVTVKDNRKVLYNGKEYYLSSLEEELQLQGNPCGHWYYEGKGLDDIYNETYEKKNNDLSTPVEILQAIKDEITQRYYKQFYIYNPDEQHSTYMWIGDKQHLIGEWPYHYEINIGKCRNNAFGHDGNHIFVELHIGEQKTITIANFFGDTVKTLEGKPEIDGFSWEKEIHSLRLVKGKNGHELSEENLINNLIKELIELDSIVGDTMREKISEYERPERIKQLIEEYKKFFYKDKKVAFYDEIYKWELLNQYKYKKDLELVNAVRKSNNLIYPSDGATLKTLSERVPNELLQIVNNLLDENKDIIKRLADFKTEMKTLVQKNLNSTNYAEDERTASNYLTYTYPEKYTFYTNEIYNKYCNYIGVNTKKTGEIYSHYCELLHELESFVSKDKELLELIANETENCYQSNLLLAQNIVYVMLKEGNFYKQNGEEAMSTKSKELIEYTELLRNKLNVILQGAPGTGKTYTTASLALSICGEDLDYNDRDAVMKRYKELREAGRIGFCTFHQSMDYEDFIEGIKPKTENGIVTYDIEDGIFKRICDEARNIVSIKKFEKIDFSKTRVFKMSLGDRNEAEEVFSYCLENNVIALGWGEDKDFSNCVKREDFKALDSTWGATAVEIFKTWMQKGDVVLISDRLKGIKAIARIVGDYEYNNSTPLRMCQFRKVEWLYNGELITTNKFYGKRLSQQSIYGFYDSNKIGKPDFNGNLNVDFLNEVITGNINEKETKPYVLIIDEINRGNVSKIFGELITLVETDKRLGNSQTELTVELPYSKEPFGVPKNLYIIGTMNTTDRSTGTLDYAVRRRFSFVTLEAQENVLVETNACEEAKALFKDVKTFIENNKLEDIDIGDLMVGHSYFMTNDIKVLKQKIRYDVIPLVKEYIKDGILTCLTSEAKEYFDDWLELKVHNPQESFE